MLSTLPKLADRTFILAFLVPSLLFVVALLLFFRDAAPANQWLADLLGKDLTTAAYTVALVWLLAVLLSAANTPIYRLLEGYIPSTPLHCLQRWFYRRRQRQDRSELAELYAQIQVARRSQTRVPDKVRARYRRLYRKVARMPPNESDILPTAFGNAIKVFETYPREVYGADSVKLWPRLLPVVSKDYATAVQDARSQVDFLVNVYALGRVFAVVALIACVRHTSWDAAWNALRNALPQHFDPGAIARAAGVAATGGFALGDFIWFGAAWLIGCVAYWWAVATVPVWGDLVMAGFDCYLPKLAEQLGYQLPRNHVRRRHFWEAFSHQAFYRNFPDGSPAFKAEDWIFPHRH
jgi:hypothetical protein